MKVNHQTLGPWNGSTVDSCVLPATRYPRALWLGRRAHAPQVCVGGRAAAGDGLPQLDAAGGAEEQGERHGDGGAPPGHALRPGVPAPVGRQWPGGLRPSRPPAAARHRAARHRAARHRAERHLTKRRGCELNSLPAFNNYSTRVKWKR